MRILLHDYGRYAFIGELARSLARRQHKVLYTFSSADTARSAVACETEEGGNLEIVGTTLSRPLVKDEFVQRRAREAEHGRQLTQLVDRFSPEVVISANAPLDAQALLLGHCRRRGIPFVYWVQDLLGIAIRDILRRKLPVVGDVIGGHYQRLERRLLCQSDRLVLISEDFAPLIAAWGVERDRMQVIHNWAPLIPPETPERRDAALAWATAHGLEKKQCLIYSGTIGMKHAPEMLLELARRLRGGDERYQVVVIAEGVGADWLRREQETQKLERLTVLPLQPFETLPAIGTWATVLLGLLSPSAGVFSVPSKALTYMTFGRPLLLSVPAENLIARITMQEEAGLIVPPGDSDAFGAAAERLLRDPALREKSGRNARRYAESHFDIQSITDCFEAVLASS